MKKQKIENRFRLITSGHLILFVIIFLFLSGIAVAADAPSINKNTNKKASIYQGTLSGKWSCEFMGSPADGIFSINISADGVVSGTFSGIESGNITGTVSDSGEINAKGSAGIATWTGHLSLVNGRLSGNGTWTGYGGTTGLWSSN